MTDEQTTEPTPPPPPRTMVAEAYVEAYDAWSTSAGGEAWRTAHPPTSATAEGRLTAAADRCAADCRELAERDEKRRQLCARLFLVQISRPDWDPRLVEAGHEPRYVVPFTFDAFETPTEAQAATLEAVRAWVEDPESTRNLLLAGPVGSGKTHLAVAAGHAAELAGVNSRYWTCVDLLAALNPFNHEHDRGAVQRVCDDAATCGLLILDDLGTRTATPAQVQNLYRIVNARWLAGRRTILTSNHAAWARILGSDDAGTVLEGERIASRLGESIKRVFVGGTPEDATWARTYPDQRTVRRARA